MKIKIGTIDLILEINSKRFTFRLDVYYVPKVDDGEKGRLAIDIQKINDKWDKIKNTTNNPPIYYLSYHQLCPIYYWVNSLYECITIALNYGDTTVWFSVNGNNKKYIWTGFYQSLSEIIDFMKGKNKELQLYSTDDYNIEKAGYVKVMNKKISKDFFTKILGHVI